MDCCASREDAKISEEETSASTPAESTKAASKQKSNGDAEDPLAKMKEAKSKLKKNKKFRKMMEDAFESVDVDKSGNLDTNEVYIAVLQLYLKIAGICKGAQPPTREKVDELVAAFSTRPGHVAGKLSLEEFIEFSESLLAQIGTRVAVQWTLQTIIAPLLGLLACGWWEKLMAKFAPELFEKCKKIVPTEVVVTLFVGIAVSQFVPPLMKLIDVLVLSSAKKNNPPGKKKA
jgi:Ca2+-binding EF-hand superfamily protein